MEFPRKSDYKVRPKGISVDTLANEGMEVDQDHDALPGDGLEEGRAIPGKKRVYEPTKEEYDEHCRTHCPFRSWCPCCVQGKSVSSNHKRTLKTTEDREKELPTIRWDYMGPKSKNDKSEKIESLPILVGVDGLKWKCAHMVPSKGLDPHAIKMIVREVKLSGYSRMILKSDQEPSILALLEAVKRELGEACEIVPEQSPVGEHQSNGQVENAIRIVQAQVRTMRIGLQSRYRRRIKADHPIMPWLIHHAAFVINICSVGEDGRTPYEIRKKKRFLFRSQTSVNAYGTCDRNR